MTIMPFFLLLLLPLTASNSGHNYGQYQRHQHNDNNNKGHLHHQKIGGPEFCDQTQECLAKVRRMAQESNRFWFGDQWHFQCSGQHHQQHQGQGGNRRNRPGAAGGGGGGGAGGNTLDCLNPSQLAPFASLGSRLFRVHTFTPAYLANLRIFPRMHFQPRSGFYRACSHNFEVTVPEEDRLFGLAGHPQARPVPAFQAQLAPDLSWPELHANQSLLVLMLDVGWGRLAYMASGFPRDIKVLADFQPIDNFRLQQPTPLAVLIFELPTSNRLGAMAEAIEAKWTEPRAERREHFDLGQFMVDHRLEKGLIGLNWVLIAADPFAIEKQRLQGGPDNCHALVLEKLLRDQRWPFVQTFPLSTELDSSLSISLAQPRLSVHACCQTQAIEEAQQLFLDPLADLEVPSVAFRQGQPTVTSLRPMDTGGGEPAYQRASRHYIVFRDERFSLLLLDPERRVLHWMLVDIPGEELASGHFDQAATVADYLPPVPERPGKCHFPVFMLFRQPRAEEPLATFFDRDHPLRHSQCQRAHCAHRANFNLEQFKALHRLQLSAINWAKVCYDLFEAGHQISLLTKKPELIDAVGTGIDRRTAAKALGGTGKQRSGRGGGSTAAATERDQQTGIMRNRATVAEREQRQQQIAAICSHFPLLPNSSDNSSSAATESRCVENSHFFTSSAARRSASSWSVGSSHHWLALALSTSSLALFMAPQLLMRGA